MKTLIILLPGFLVLFLAGTMQAAEPELEEGVFIQDGGSDLLVDWCSVPCVVDWNNDGAKDLLVGQFVNGWIWLFLNEGTDLNPLFNGGSLVESNGSPIKADAG
ncbi:MAG: hypothetical protein ACYTG7_08240 [Planctomycetota bacterium]